MKLKNDFSAGGRANYVQQILCFKVLNKVYFVVARSAGLVQLYEKVTRKPPASSLTISYKLVKEWKNSTAGPRDPVVAVGSFCNQYMYTCSREGKLVIRDLINDDADNSVKAYIIDGPVLCVNVQTTTCNMRIIVAAGGCHNVLKFYDLDFGSTDAYSSSLERIYSVGISRSMANMIRLSNIPTDHRLGLQRNTHVHHIRTSFADSRRLVPTFSSLADSIYSALQLESLTNWVLSLCFVGDQDSRKLCAGTQFGDLMVYDATAPFENHKPLHVLHLSQFSLNTLNVFNRGRYLVYSDTMSKVGVIDVETMKVVNFFDFLKIGPTVASRVYTAPDTGKVSKGSKLSRFSPFYVVASTVDGTIVVYRLCDSNESELRLFVHQAGVVPSLDVLDADAYSALEEVFGDGKLHEKLDAPSKRRKPDRGEFILPTTAVPEQNPLVNEIKTMKIVN